MLSVRRSQARANLRSPASTERQLIVRLLSGELEPVMVLEEEVIRVPLKPLQELGLSQACWLVRPPISNAASPLALGDAGT